MYYSHNFGHKGKLEFHGLGINGKISELQAALGLALLPYMPEILAARKVVVDYYDQHLDFSVLQKLRIRENTDWNYGYYPVIFQSEQDLLEAQDRMNAKDIFPRRYFYPSLNTLSFTRDFEGHVPVAESISKRILCLPIFHTMTRNQQDQVIESILNSGIHA